MSIHFNWEELSENSAEIEQKICDFLHKQFQAITLPPFISSLAVSSFKLGSVPPEIALKHFSDPFPEFYMEDDTESSSGLTDTDLPSIIDPGSVDETDTGDTDNPSNYSTLSEPDTTRLEHVINNELQDHTLETSIDMDDHEVGGFDIQSYIELKYAGDMQLAITATLLVNYPTPGFISLPVSIKVTNIDIHTLIVAAFIKPRLYLSIISDLEDSNNLKRADTVNVIKSMKIESEIGDNSDQGAVLRNVSKVEKFVIEQLRNVISEELVWPGWLTLEL